MSTHPLERLQSALRAEPAAPTLLVAPDADPLDVLDDRVRSAARLARAPAPLSSVVDAVEAASRWIEAAPRVSPETPVDRWLAARTAPTPTPKTRAAPTPTPDASARVDARASSAPQPLSPLLAALAERDLPGAARAEVARLIARTLEGAAASELDDLRVALSIVIHGLD